MRNWHWPAVVVFTVVLTGVTTTPSSDTRTSMRGLYEALTSVLLLSFDDDAFQDSDNHEKILVKLRQLSSNASRLERHAEDLADSYDYLRRSLARDSRDAAKRFESEEYVGARFVIEKLTENCMACHTRQKSRTELNFGKAFIEDERVTSLPLENRVRLAIATRQFDNAMETCEAILASDDMIADQIVVAGVFEDYFKLTLRVGQDVSRPIATLETFYRRADVPSYLSEVVAVWLSALKEVDLDASVDNALPRAREWIEDARRANRFPADRQGLVHFVAASGLLHRFLSTDGSNDTQRSEAYYLLGLAESHMSRSYWVSETDFFLERAIRLAPRNPWARKAYALMEAYTVAFYSGSGGVNVPHDVQATLDELKKLID
jgi:hypothetical protein